MFVKYLSIWEVGGEPWGLRFRSMWWQKTLVDSSHMYLCLCWWEGAGTLWNCRCACNLAAHHYHKKIIVAIMRQGHISMMSMDIAMESHITDIVALLWHEPLCSSYCHFGHFCITCVHLFLYCCFSSSHTLCDI